MTNTYETTPVPTTATGTAATGTTATTGSGRLVTGLFPDRTSAEAAYATTHARGYGSDDVNLVMSDETRQRHFGEGSALGDSELGNKAGKGAGIGGTIGAIAAAIAAVGTSLVLPGLGLVIAGPLAAAVAGAAGGGIIGALIGAGMPEERAKEYEEGVKGGGILMGVHAKTDEDAAHFEDQWRTTGGQKVYR